MNKKSTLIIILGLMAFLANGDTYAVSSLMGSIAHDLNIEQTMAARSVTSYMMAFGAFTLFFGPLSDRFGKANIINIAAIGTSIFSILGGFAWDLNSLIAFRSINGMFGAGILPVTMSLIGDSFDDKERQGALAKVMGLAFFGTATATAIGGSISFFSSWRFVYIFYGILELILSVLMLKILKRDKPKVDSLNLIKTYKIALSNKSLVLVVFNLFFVGFAVLGSFAYTGMMFSERTGLNTLVVGLLLSSFGVGTVLGSKVAPIYKARFPQNFILASGLTGFVAYMFFSLVGNVIVMMLGLLLFGMSFIIIQSTIVANAQGRLPSMKGTAMSMASFFMFTGGATGSHINSMIINSVGIKYTFIISAILFVLISMVANVFVKRK